jgi:hypothetical protein
MGFTFNESLLNKTGIINFDNAHEYVTIDSCKAYAHDLIQQLRALEFVLGLLAVVGIYALWKTGRIQEDYKKIIAFFNKKDD